MTENYLEKLINSSRITGLSANRAGDAIVTVNSIDQDCAKYRSRLFSVCTAGGEFRSSALTAPESGANLLAISEAGEIFITLDKPVDGAESESLEGVYRLPQRGEAELVLAVPGGADHLEVRGRGEGEVLIYSARSIGNDSEAATKVLDQRKKQKVSAILHETFPTRFWDHDHGIGHDALFIKEAGKDPVQVELPEGILSDFTVDPTGRRALVTMRHNLRGVHGRYSVFLVDLFGREDVKTIAEADERISWFGGDFNPSGTRAFLTKEHNWLSDQALNLELAVFDFEAETISIQAEDVDRWANETVWIDDDNFAFVSDNLGASAVFRAEVDGEFFQLTDDNEHYSNLHFSSGTLIALCDSHQHSAYPVRIHEDKTAKAGEVKPLEEPPIKALQAPGRLEKFITTVEDGIEITSWLALPEKGDGPFPLVVFAHGGPWGSWNSWTYRWNPWVLTEAGYAVLLPDPAISTGYGQSMIERGGHSVGKEPYTDILATIDQVSQRDDIDADRAAFMGGSYGGYMTNWVAGQQGERFKCYITHASIWNQEHMYTTTDNGTWHEWMWEKKESVRDQYSPHQFAENIKAPVMIIHGDKDYRVPISQGQMLWFDLQRNSPELDHKFLYFPDEGHWILKPGNSKIWYETVLAYLNKHVLGHDFEAPELLGYPTEK